MTGEEMTASPPEPPQTISEEGRGCRGRSPLRAFPPEQLRELDRVTLAVALVMVVLNRLASVSVAGSARAAPAGTGRRAAARPAGRLARDAVRRRRAALTT
ncbi:hypothetical protein Mame01_53540 [Microbispora amethystogenes]|nr:hypothetical protein Mame01_53540 [Microbispora amethystogenes]